MALPITQPGGLRPLNTDEKATKDLFTDLQTMGLSALFNLVVARLFHDQEGAAPESGFIGKDCLPEKGAGSLDVDVAAGIGFYYDSSESDPHELIYKPVVVRAGFTEALSAHDPADPRYDIICLAPARDDDESATLYFYGGSTGSAVTRRRFGYTLQVVEGTPAASPSVPSTPAGYIKIAECLVPAASGDVTVTDKRVTLQINPGLAGPPGPDYHQNWVPGSSTELQVVAGSYPNVTIAAGGADIEGRRYSYDADTLAMPTADGTYYVWAAADGTFGRGLITDYTAHADGPRAGAEEGEVAAVLASVTIDTGTTSVTVDSDMRRRNPYNGSDLEDDSVNASKLGFTIVKPQVTEGAWEHSGNSSVNVNIQAKDPSGSNIAFAHDFLVELVNAGFEPLTGSWSLTVSTGTAVTTTGDATLVVTANASGAAVVNAEYLGGPFPAGTLYAKVTPLNYAGGTSYVALSP